MTFYKNIGFLIGFLILVTVITGAFGEKTAERFLLLVMLGMMLSNTAEFEKFFNSFKPAND